jgi:type II secretory pathway component PulJ
MTLNTARRQLTGSRTLQRNGARPNGYTLIEMVVGMALTMLMLLLAVNWTSTLIRTSSTAIELRSSARDSEYARLLLAEDLASAKPCNSNGLGWSLVSSSPTQIAFYADVVVAGGGAGRDGNSDLVVWELTSTTLERGVAVGTGTCPIAVGTDTRVAVTAKASATGSTAAFVTYGVGGGQLTAASCSAIDSSCDATAVRMRVTVSRSTPQDSPTELDTTASFARTGRWMP